ncbi:hypothetical protein BH11PSE11_BH11PSE11_17650 [soil metagenome]
MHENAGPPWSILPSASALNALKSAPASSPLPSPPTASRPRWLAFHFLYFFLSFALASLFAAWLGGAGSVIVMVLLWLPMIWAVPALWQRVFGEEQDLHWLAIPMVLLTVMNVSLTLPSLLPLLRQRPIPSIRASEIDRYPGVAAFRFHDAVVRLDYAYLHTAQRPNGGKSSTSTTVYATVAPITDAGWSKEQAVLAWAACDGNGSGSKRCSAWGRINAGAVIVNPQGEQGMEQAVREAVRKFGLREAPAPRLLKWVSSIEDEIQSRVVAYAASLLGIYLAWLLLYCCGRIATGWVKKGSPPRT